MQRLCFYTARQHFSARRSYGVVGARQTRDRVEQDHYVVSALYESFGFLVYDVRHLHVVLCRLIESRGDHLGIDAALHVCHLFRALVDKQHDHIYLGVVLQNSVGQLFEQHRLTGFRLRYDQSALTLADRRKEVDHTYAQTVAVTRAEFEFLIGEEWGEVLECHTALGQLRRQAVDADHLVHWEELVRLRVDAY